MMAMEDTYFSMAKKRDSGGRGTGTTSNCLVICDRGAMDASAFVDTPEEWRELLARLGKEDREEDVCEDRYDHVVHMVRGGGGGGRR